MDIDSDKAHQKKQIDMVKVLILCTGNSCRSQMAHGYLKSLDAELDVYSAGTRPAEKVNSLAVKCMDEIGIDISSHIPHHVRDYMNKEWDYVITVCDNAREICPVFTGKVTTRLHIGFDDPYDATGSEEERMQVYRRVRDEIRQEFKKLYTSSLKQ